MRQLHALCRQEFGADELESEQSWLVRLASRKKHQASDEQEEDEFATYSFVVAVDSATNTVLAGASLEYYHAARCGCVGFVVVDKSLRGQGVCPKVMRAANDELARLAAVQGHELLGVFIDVQQVQDVAHNAAEADAARVRQKIWTKMGFLPLEGVDLTHPGAMAHGRYCVCVHVADPSAPFSLPYATVEQFLACYFQSALLSLSVESGNSAAAGGCAELDATLATVITSEGGRVKASAEFWK